MKNGGVIINPEVSYTGKRTFTGPGVLFPRVGLVTPKKVCILPTGKAVVLSDCILAIPCESIQAAIQLQSTILSYWEIFAGGYSGTGAPYITIDRAKKVVGLCLIEQKMRNEEKDRLKSLQNNSKLKAQRLQILRNCVGVETDWQSKAVTV